MVTSTFYTNNIMCNVQDNKFHNVMHPSIETIIEHLHNEITLVICSYIFPYMITLHVRVYNLKPYSRCVECYSQRNSHQKSIYYVYNDNNNIKWATICVVWKKPQKCEKKIQRRSNKKMYIITIIIFIVLHRYDLALHIITYAVAALQWYKHHVINKQFRFSLF